MEMILTSIQLKKWLQLLGCLCFLFVMVPVKVTAQQPVKIYTIKNGRMYIELSKSLGEPALDSFIAQFKLSELALKKFIKEGIADSIEMNGWKIDENTKELFSISKPLLSSDKINDLAGQMILSVADRFPSVGSGLVIGYNRFKNNAAFEVHDSAVKFFLRNNIGSKRVMLAGSFNDFSTNALPMQKTDSGWIVYIKLGPGKYWYKFIADGNWMIDENNLLRENDGEGNTNSVYYKTNTRFRLGGFTSAKKVYLAGSFNNWQPKELLLQKNATGWELPLYLADGTYTYRFVADGKWFADSANADRLPNEFGEFNSVIKIGMPYLFRLNGFTDAGRVWLTGSFNGWRKDELLMNKTANGWELPYTLGLGNYEYRFVVDRTEITDPANPVFTNQDRAKGNSVLILGANYTFRLKGFQDAKAVFLAGDFNNFNATAFNMSREGNDWVCRVHLSVGKHLYKFVVDGKWIIDPGNKLWEQNQYGTGNSVLWIEP